MRQTLGAGLTMLVLGCAFVPGMAVAQQRVPQTCTAPPFDPAVVRRAMRAPGFDLLMRQMAKACPEIAMVYATVTIGPVSNADPRRWLVLLPFAPADVLAAQEF